jgi:ABC-type antimicrobial peptide transport system permease subunit
VGATEIAIQLQFLGKSIVLSLVGGAAGVFVGIFGRILKGMAVYVGPLFDLSASATRLD